MNERIEATQNPEIRVINIFDKVTQIVSVKGTRVEGNWKKAVAVFKDGIDDETVCASVAIHAGNTTGEVKIIYERDEKSGGVKRSEMAFRQDGTFNERVFRSPAKNLPSFELESEITEPSDSKLNEVDNLLITTEAWLRTHPQEVPCNPQKSRSGHRHSVGYKYKRPQGSDKREQRVF